MQVDASFSPFGHPTQVDASFSAVIETFEPIKCPNFSRERRRIMAFCGAAIESMASDKEIEAPLNAERENSEERSGKWRANQRSQKSQLWREFLRLIHSLFFPLFQLFPCQTPPSSSSSNNSIAKTRASFFLFQRAMMVAQQKFVYMRARASIAWYYLISAPNSFMSLHWPSCPVWPVGASRCKFQNVHGLASRLITAVTTHHEVDSMKITSKSKPNKSIGIVYFRAKFCLAPVKNAWRKKWITFKKGFSFTVECTPKAGVDIQDLLE